MSGRSRSTAAKRGAETKRRKREQAAAADEPQRIELRDAIIVHVLRDEVGNTSTAVQVVGDVRPLEVPDALTLARQGYRKQKGLEE